MIPLPGKSDWLENQILNHVLRGTVYTPPAALFVALFTSDPGEAGTGTEASGGGYARQAVTFTNSTSGSSSNSADILFPVATAAWGTLTHFGIYDAATAGKLLYMGALTPSQPIAVSNQLKIFAGTLTVSED
ncbi:phage tail fiber protein [Paenibacillus albicereus]